jgi:biotin carboxyl carrier protein
MEKRVKLKALLNDQEYDLVINEEAGSIRVQIDGRLYQLQVQNPDSNSYLIFNSERIYDCRVEPIPKSRERFEVQLKNKRHSILIIDPRRMRTDENSDRQHHGPTEIRAQMPGKVVRVLVESGSVVDKNASIVVVEAMKMQNEMKAPRAGIVIAVNVKSGDTVNAGEVLATVGDS